MAVGRMHCGVLTWTLTDDDNSRYSRDPVAIAAEQNFNVSLQCKTYDAERKRITQNTREKESSQFERRTALAISEASLSNQLRRQSPLSPRRY